MMRMTLAIVATIVLTGCETTPYVPEQFRIKDGLIQKFAVNGTALVSNAQTSTKKVAVSSGSGVKLASNYRDITQLMVDQTKKEIEKNAVVSPAEQTKVIDLKVTQFHSSYAAFYWTTEIRFTATLGVSDTVEITSHYGGSTSSQALNGGIAQAVTDLLNDRRVPDYLAQ